MTIEAGTRVAFRAQFLRDIGDYGPRGSWRGTVLAIEDLSGLRLASVRWDGARTPQHVNAANLIRADKLHLEPA